MQEIPDLNGMIRPFLEDNVKITNYTTRSLIAPGENYGSIMLAVDVTLSDTKKLHLVAKKCPSSEFIRKIFNTPVTFKKEMLFYKEILPSMQNFRKRNGRVPLDSFVKYYGSRYSLEPMKEEIDEDCCLLLENIKVLGFDIADRMNGFNYDCTRFIVKDLATFHAVSVAMRLKEPERFQAEILQLITTPIYTSESLPDETIDKKEIVINRIAQVKKYKPHMRAIKPILAECAKHFFDQKSNVIGPFGSIVHSDYWIVAPTVFHMKCACDRAGNVVQHTDEMNTRSLGIQQ